MRENKLWLNEEKTEFLWIGAKHPLAKVNIVHTKGGKVNIAPHSPVKNLGVWIDFLGTKPILSRKVWFPAYKADNNPAVKI